MPHSDGSAFASAVLVTLTGVDTTLEMSDQIYIFNGISA